MVPHEGYIPESADYAKIAKPEIQMYIIEMALFGGVPGFPGSDVSRDPDELDQSDLMAGINSFEDDDGATDINPDEDDGTQRSPVDMKAIREDDEED
jgi:hypothetical protein